MNPLHLIWLSSLVGALLFAWLGWSLASLRTRGAGALPDHAEALRQQLEQHRAGEARLAAQLEDSARQVAALASEAAAASEANAGRAAAEQAQDSLRAQLSAMQRAQQDQSAAAHELARTRQELQQCTAALAAAKAEAVQARERADAATTRAGELERRAQPKGPSSSDQENARIRAEAARNSDRVAQLQKELDKTRGELDELRAQAHRAVALERDHALLAERSKESDARAVTLDQRCRELDQSASELRAGLTTARADVEELSRRLRESQQRASGLNSRLDAATRELEEAQAAARAAGDRPTQGRIGDEQSEDVGELRFRLAALQARVAEAERARQEAAQLRDQLSELQELRDKARQLDTLSTEHRRLRLDHSMMAERAASLERTVAQYGEAERRMRELELEAKEAGHLRERLAELEPLALARAPAPSKHSPALIRQQPSRDVFAELRRKDAFRSAAVADTQGLLVHGDGLAEQWESLAAVGGLACRFADNIGSLLPIGKISLIHLYGAHDAVLSCWLTGTHQEPIVMSALGIGAPIGQDAWLRVANPFVERENA